MRRRQRRLEVWSWAGELVDDQAVHQRQEVVDVTRWIRRSEFGQQLHHPHADLVLEVGDLRTKGRLVRRFDEDRSSGLAEHACLVGELLEESTDRCGNGLNGGGTDVDGQPGPHRGLSLEEASEHPDEERFAGPEAVRGRPDRQAGGGVDGSMGELSHATRSQHVDGGIEQSLFTVQHLLHTTSVVK